MSAAFLDRFAGAAAALVAFAGREAALAAVVFAAVWGVTRLAGRAPARLHAALWSLVLARLALPPGLAAPWSARALLERVAAWLGAGAAGAGTAAVAHPTAVEGGGAIDLAGRLLAAGPAAAGGWPVVLATAWIAGAAAVAAHLLLRRRVYRRAAAAASAATGTELAALAEKWRRRLGVRRPVALRVTNRELPPFTLGVLRPVIILPRTLVAAAGERPCPLLEAVVGHEMAHVRRFDALRLGLQNAVQAVWFWHPAAWWAAARLNDARERIADELVLAGGRIARRDYAACLLAVLRLNPAAPGGLAAAPALVHPQRRIAMRIHEILRARPAGRFPALAPALIAGLCALLLLPMANSTAAGGESAPASAAPSPATVAGPTPAPEAAPAAVAVAAPSSSPSPSPAAALAAAAAPSPPAVPAPPATPSPPAVPTRAAAPAAPSPPAVPAPPAAPSPPAVPTPAAAPAAPVAPVTPAVPVPPAPAAMPTPLPDARLTSAFGARRDPRSGRRSHHDGVDLAAPRGTVVLAPAAGRVKVASANYGSDGHHGKTVVLDHGNGLETLYAHLDAILVKRGDEVSAGQTIGRVGSSGWATGPHLHFEVLRDGKPVDPASMVLDLETPAQTQ